MHTERDFRHRAQRKWLSHLSLSLSPARSLTVALNSLLLSPWAETAVGVPSWQLQRPITSAKARKSPGTEDAFTFDISTSAVAWEGTCRCAPVREISSFDQTFGDHTRNPQLLR
jgi:hypothetical protein